MLIQLEEKERSTVNKYLEDVPYYVSKEGLYSPFDLYEDYDPDNDETKKSSYDAIVYKHFLDTGKHASSTLEALARSLHDHFIMAALDQFLAKHNPRKNIGIMGGHALLRTDDMYRQIVLLCKRLTELGFIMISGGGPGAMEATHLGAWMAGRSAEEVDDALQILSVDPRFQDEMWLNSAFRVIKKYPQTQYESLGVPTWLYGHEPSTPFASQIAKLFQNSIREDGILTIAFGGIVYTPGSAGTMQEIFQDAVQNHYLSFGYASPMLFYGQKYWTEEMPVYPFIQKLMENGKYKNLILNISDNPDDIIAELVKFRDNETI